MLNMKRLLPLVLVLGFYFQATSQIISTYPKENPVLKKYSQQYQPPATDRDKERIDLPFFDDFSYTGPYPVASHWEDRDVFINNAWANKPVSVGFATFDGLDATGSPHGGGNGSSDALTSVELNLGGLSKAYISYYVQAKGLGDAPEPSKDLVLEFKTPTGDWVEVQRHTQSLQFFPRDSVTEFSFVGPIAIEEVQYLYDGFQFRFVNYSDNNGAVDLWHLDYVRVEEQPTNQVIQDLAFTELPPSIFKTYSSAPWTHYVSSESDLSNVEARQDFKVELFNHATQNIQIEGGELGTFNVIEGAENEIFVLDDLFANPSVAPNRQEVDYGIGFNFSTLITPLQAVPFIQENNLVFIKTEYQMFPNPQEEDIPEITRNDKVASITELNDYYAYDDGSVESAVQIAGLGGQAAMEFYNYKQDSIRGFQIQIPRIAASNGNITLKVWLDDLNTPPIVELPISPFFIDEVRDTLQAFTTYALKDQFTGAPTPVELPVGTFFVGWEQGLCQGASCVAVGLDRNSLDAAKFMYLNDDGNWRNVAENEQFYGHLKGALMIRPILGDKTPLDSELATSTLELPIQELMNIFPNPAQDIVSIQLFDGAYEEYQVQIFNALGQLVKRQILQPQLTIAELEAGSYYLQLIHQESKAVGFHKLTIQK